MQEYSLLRWVIYALSFAVITASYSNATLGTCGYSSTCSVSGYEGACVSISSNCCGGGVVSSGLCPGSDDIKCCTQAPCSTPSGSGTCMQTSLCSSKGGTSVGGYCSGPSDLQCCIQPPAPSSCSYSATCNVAGYEGVCVSISSGCCASGVVSTGLCPGSDDIKCCTQPKCSTPSGSGVCMQTSLCASYGGSSVAGYCNGTSDLQCCLGGTPTPTSGIYGVDVSTTISASSASCFASNGFAYVVPRAYMSIGSVDTQACTSLTNAYNAGIKTRDVYLFPCPTCSKSAATQMSEMISYLNNNCKGAWSGRVWLDIEGTEYWLGSASSNQAWYKVSFFLSIYSPPLPVIPLLHCSN
jgi:hypothetical protein